MSYFRNRATGAVTGDAQTAVLEWRYQFVGGVAIQITGTFTGTLTFQISLDGSTYVSLQMGSVTNSSTRATSATTPGMFWEPVHAATTVRVLSSGWSAGTANVTIVGLPS